MKVVKHLPAYRKIPHVVTAVRTEKAVVPRPVFCAKYRCREVASTVYGITDLARHSDNLQSDSQRSQVSLRSHLAIDVPPHGISSAHRQASETRQIPI